MLETVPQWASADRRPATAERAWLSSRDTRQPLRDRARGWLESGMRRSLCTMLWMVMSLTTAN